MHPAHQSEQQQPQQVPQPQTGQRVYNLTRRGDPRNPGDQEQQQIIIVIDEDVLRLFVRQVYMLAIIFIVAASVTWLIVCNTQFDLYKESTIPCYVWGLLAFFFMMILNCVPATRYLFPCNWIMTLCVVVFITIAIAYPVIQLQIIAVLIGLILSLVLVAVLYYSGATCPQEVLPGGTISLCLLGLIVIALFVICIVSIFAMSPELCLAFVILLFTLTVITIPMHAQYIHGRFQLVPLFEMLACALYIFIDFAVSFVCLGYFYYYHSVYVKNKDT